MTDPAAAETILRDNARKMGKELIRLGGAYSEEYPFVCCPRCDSIMWLPEGDFRRCRRCAELWRPN